MKISKLLTTLQYFVDNIALTDIKDIAQQFDMLSDEFYTPKEIEEYNR